jgi:hypothetical protein
MGSFGDSARCRAIKTEKALLDCLAFVRVRGLRHIWRALWKPFGRTNLKHFHAARRYN